MGWPPRPASGPSGLQAKRGWPKRFMGLKFQPSPSFLENGLGQPAGPDPV